MERGMDLGIHARQEGISSGIGDGRTDSDIDRHSGGIRHGILTPPYLCIMKPKRKYFLL